MVMALLILGLGGWRYYEKVYSPTANWQTYKSDNGWTFYYPNSWNATEFNSDIAWGLLISNPKSEKIQDIGDDGLKATNDICAIYYTFGDDKYNYHYYNNYSNKSKCGDSLKNIYEKNDLWLREIYKNKTADWKTHADKHMNFQIKYPPTWKSCEHTGGQVFELTISKECYSSDGAPREGQSIFFSDGADISGDYPDYRRLLVALKKAKTLLPPTFNERSKSLNKNFGGSFDVADVEETAINGIPAIRVDKAINETTKDRWIYVFNNQRLLSINLGFNYPRDPEVEQIISTFKFTK